MRGVANTPLIVKGVAMPEKTVVTIVESASKLVSRDPSYIYWLTANPATLGTSGTISIYDGFDANGRKVFEMKTGYDRFNTFIPPIDCEQGIYVAVDANIDTYVIGYLTKKWANGYAPG